MTRSSNMPVLCSAAPNAPIQCKTDLHLGHHPAAYDRTQETPGSKRRISEATSPELNLSGRFVFDYTAVGYENVTVPFGTFNALRVDATIRIEVSGFRIQAGTYTTSTWLVPEIGMVKSEGTSHVPGLNSRIASS